MLNYTQYPSNMSLETDILQKKPFKSPVEKAMVNVIFTNNWIHDKQHYLLKKYGISMQQYNVLRILKGQKGKPITINGIIDRMLDKMSNASRLVDKLVQKKLVDRTFREDDRRACDVTINDEGEKFLSKVTKELQKFQTESDTLTEKEYEKLNELLDKFRGHYKR